jgi:hypothetical protein
MATIATQQDSSSGARITVPVEFDFELGTDLVLALHKARPSAAMDALVQRLEDALGALAQH